MSQISSIPPTTASAPQVEPAVQPEPAAASASTSNAQSHASTSPDQRLLIQESEQLGVFVYTVIDRASGAVVLQIPHEQMAHIADLDDYASGQVVNTKA